MSKAETKSKSGSKDFRYLKVLEAVDGTDVSIPYAMITGRKAGPKLYVGAAIHGDEVNGVFVVRDIISRIEPNELKGSVLAVPVQNPAAFRARRRLAPQGIPVDEADINDFFPGRLDGKAAEVVAHHLFQGLMTTAGYAIDLHTGTSFQEVCKTFTPSHRYGETSRKSLEMARAFGVRLLYDGMYEDERWFENFLAARSIPTVGVELGQGSTFQPEYVKRGVEGVLNVLKLLGMLEGPCSTPEDMIVIRSEVNIRAASGGIIQIKGKVGEKVSKNDTIATITTPLGDRVQTVKAPMDGYLNNVLTIPTVSVGERIATIGSTQP